MQKARYSTHNIGHYGLAFEYYINDAQRHALCHDDAEVCAQRQLHGTEGQKARDGRQTGRRDGAHGLTDGVLHGLFVGGTERLFLVVAVEQEDGEIHRHAQLQDRGNVRSCLYREL